MNVASWIILVIVVAILALAVKATFFKKKRKGGCCDIGDAGDDRGKAGAKATGCASTCVRAASGCGDCAACGGYAAKLTLQPTYHDVEK